MERRFLTAVSSVGLAALAVTGISALKDLSVAARFGTSDSLDAYLQAFVLFLLVTNTCVSALSDAFLPVFVRADQDQTTPAARRLVRAAIATDAAIMIGISAVLILARQPIFAVMTASFGEEKRSLSENLFVLLTPALVLSSAGAAMIPILNVRGKLKRAALIPIVTPLITFAALVFNPQPSIWILPIALVFGKLIELALASWGVTRLGYSVIPGWTQDHDTVARVTAWLRQCVPLAVAGLLTTGSVAIDQAVAGALGPGAVSSLNFGTRVTLAIVGIGTLSLTAFIFPEFSRLILGRQFKNIRGGLKRYTLITFAASFLLTVCVLAFSEQIITVLFQHGAFTEQDTMVVQQVQNLFVLQVPFSVTGIVLVRFLSSLGHNHVLMVFSVIMLTVNAIADVILAQLLGVAGIALSTSIVFVVSFSLLLFESHRAIKLIEDHHA